MRKTTAIILVILFLLGTASCYDSSEIDDMAYVIAIGIDIGVSDKWRITLQFPTAKEEGAAGGGGGGEEGQGGGEGEYAFICVDAPSFFTGIDMLGASMPKKLNFTHAHIIVFSEELARKGLAGEFIAPIIRFREIRRSAHVFVVKEKASEFIKENKSFMGGSLAKDFLLLVRGNETTGYFPRITLQDFYNGIKSTYYQPMAIMAAVNDGKNFKKEGSPYETGYKTGGDYGAGEMPRKGENKIEFWGSAVFDGDKMTGSLNGDETRYALMARGQFRNGHFTFVDPERPDLIVVLNVKMHNKPDVKIDTGGENPSVSIKIQLDGDLSSVQSAIDYEGPPKSTMLEDMCKKIIKKNIERVIKKCQTLSSDVFLFGCRAAKNFWTIEDWDKYNWNVRFKDAEIDVQLDFFLRETGTQIRTSPIREAEAEK